MKMVTKHNRTQLGI